MTVRKIGTPLAELLQELSSKDLLLSVNRTCDGQKLQINLKQRSLRTLTQALAELMPGEWTAKDNAGGYTFRMTDKAAGRRQEWWNLWMGEREKALAAQRAWVLQSMRGNPPPAREINVSPQQHTDMTQGHEFFQMLSPALQERLANQMDETTFYRDSFGTDNTEGTILLPVSEFSEAAREAARKRILSMPGLPAGFDPDSAVVHLNNGGINVLAGFTLPDGRDTGTAFNGNLPSLSVAMPLLGPDHFEAPNIVRRLGDQAPEGWKQLALFQQSRVWRSDATVKPTLQEQRRRRVEWLQWLGNTAGTEYVSDYYSQPGDGMTSAEKALLPPRPLKAELDTLAAAQDVSWKHSGPIILVRDNRWYRNDWLEVPATTLRRWQALTTLQPERRLPSASTQAFAQQRVKQLCDWQADIVNALSPWQLGWGLKYARYESAEETAEAFLKREPKKERMQSEEGPGMEYTLPWESCPFWRNTQSLLGRYKLTQFYAALDANARNALLGEGLDFAVLSAEQQAQALYLMPDLQIWRMQHSTFSLKLRLLFSLPDGIIPVGFIMGKLRFVTS